MSRARLFSGVLFPLGTVLFWLAPAVVPHAQRSELDGIGFDKGNPEAPLLVVEFADFGCSACGQFAQETFPVIDDQLIQSGRVRWKVIPFELGVFKRSKEATVASICAAEQNGFWEFHDSLFARRGEWQRERKPLLTFQRIAAGIRLDTAAFALCYDSDNVEERAKSLRRLAREHGVRGTPTFFIGDRKLEGAPPTDEFLELLNAWH